MIQKEPENQKLITHLARLEPDGMTHFMLADSSIRGAVLHGTDMINRMRSNHETGILETMILGHAYMAAGLMTLMIKGNDIIGLSIECAGPAGGLSAESTSRGEIRGFLKNNPIPVESPVESFDLSPFFGPGFLTVTKKISGSEKPFTGQVMLEHGNIAQDLAHYYRTSEQISTFIALSVQFDPDGSAVGAGGLFLQALPGTDTEVLADIENHALQLPSFGAFFAEGKTRAAYISGQFAGFSPLIIGSKQVLFHCGCSRERFGSFLASMSREQKESILTEGPFPLKTTCHNCNTTHDFSREELQSLFSN